MKYHQPHLADFAPREASRRAREIRLVAGIFFGSIALAFAGAGWMALTWFVFETFLTSPY